MEPRKQSALNYVRHLVSQTSIVTPRGGGGKRGGVPVHYKPQARFSGDCDVQRRNLRIFLKGEAPSLLF